MAKKSPLPKRDRKPSHSKPPEPPKATVSRPQVLVWQLDPGWPDERRQTVACDAPALPDPDEPLAYRVVDDHYQAPPAPLRHRDTTQPGFRYWNLVAAANRCRELWRPVVPVKTEWRSGGPLEIRVNGSEGLNAYYIP